MNISNSQLLNYVTGYLRADEADGYISLSRFTEKQAQSLCERGFSPRENATAGMKLEFITDGSSFSFDYRIRPGSSRNIYGIDLLENGVNTQCASGTTSDTSGTFTGKLKAHGEKRVTVCFPNLTRMEIKNFRLDGEVKPCKRKLKYLALGDSITQGYVTKHPCLSYANLVAEKLDACVLNQAIGGDIFYADNIDPTVKQRFSPDLITVAYGTNDWAHDADVYSGAQGFFNKLRTIYAQVPMFAILPIHRNGIDGVLKRGITLEAARTHIGAAACENGITVIDSRDFVPHHEDYYSDKVHPNELGFVFYAENLYNELKKHL